MARNKGFWPIDLLAKKSTPKQYGRYMGITFPKTSGKATPKAQLPGVAGKAF